MSGPDDVRFMPVTEHGRRQTAGRLLPALILGGMLHAMTGQCLAADVNASTLDAVRQRGELVCGVGPDSPGFAFPDSTGRILGIDAEHCRAIAAAALGDASKVRFVTTTTTSRFTALQSGEVDVLIRGTTWTLGREASLGLMVAGIYFYDGTGFLVKAASGVTSAMELDGAAVCVQPGTSTELAVSDFFRINRMAFTPVVIESTSETNSAFLAGRCDAYAYDVSTLASFRYQQGEGGKALTLLPEVISKEPFGLYVRKGDDRWFELVRWVHTAMIEAEELDLSSSNIDAASGSANPDVRRFLGLEGDLGKALGLRPGWAGDVVRQVGSYGEVWERTITPLGIPRGLNRLWNQGGLHYPPPMR